MVKPKRSLLVALLTLVAGCREPARTPRETVELYLRSVGRDPARALSLVSDAFHERHGLAVANLEGWSWGIYDDVEPVEPGPDDPFLALSQRPRGLDSAQIAWLMVQADGEFQQTARELHFELLGEVVEQGDRAFVAMRIGQPGAGFPFVEQLGLVRRGPGRPWRINAIEQIRVPASQASAAFVAHPTEAARQAVAARREAARQRAEPPPAPTHE